MGPKVSMATDSVGWKPRTIGTVAMMSAGVRTVMVVVMVVCIS